ncbi:MAG: hypothetical protein ABIX28_10780 [Vicinamibacterales bacterium]
MNRVSPRRRIVFTGDILQTTFEGRPKMSMETRWLADLLHYQVSLASPAATLDVVSWDEPGSGFDGGRFYALNGMTPSVTDWAALEGAETISEPALAYLSGFFDDAMVIGNTMSAFQTRLFERLGVPYVDFILHPARFLDDLCFGIRTNVPEIFGVLQAHRYPDEAILLQASIHRAGLRRPAPADVAPGSGLFTAQHGIDKALVRDGRFCSIEDYASELAAFVDRHPVVYVKPHPYARETARVLTCLRAIARSEERIRLIDANIYALLCNPHIAGVCGISSCAVYEAEYFGKPATFLSTSRVQLAAEDDDPTSRRFVAVYDAFFNPGFWRELLASVCPVTPGRTIELPRKTSRLRHNLSLYWGYSQLDWERPLQALGVVPPAASTPAPAPWASHAEGLLHREQDHLEAAIESFSTAVADEPSAERWIDWSEAQLAAGRPGVASSGLGMAVAHGLVADWISAASAAANTARLDDAVRQSRCRATLLVGVDASTDMTVVRQLSSKLYHQRWHLAISELELESNLPPVPPDLDAAADAWRLAHAAAALFRRLPNLPAAMPVGAVAWAGDPLVARLSACGGRPVVQLADGREKRMVATVGDWLRSGPADGLSLETATASELDHACLPPLAARGARPAAFDERGIPGACVAPRANTDGMLARRALAAGRLGSHARLGATRDLHHGLPGVAPEADVTAPVLLARLWLARLRGDAAEGRPAWLLRTPATWPAAVAIVRCAVRAGEHQLALEICRHYEPAVSRTPAIAAELEYLAAGAARERGRLADAAERYERILRRSRSDVLPSALVAGARYHLAAAAESTGHHGRARQLAAACLDLVPDHRAARALLQRVSARATVGG